MPFIKVSSGIQIHYKIPSCPNRLNPTLDPSKPVVLLLHPRFFDMHFFAPQYNDSRLAKGYNLVCIARDLTGYFAHAGRETARSRPPLPWRD